MQTPEELRDLYLGQSLPENEGVQLILLRVHTAEDAEPPAEWDWSALADMHRPDAITVEWAGPFEDT
jgi:hypothetical protein